MLVYEHRRTEEIVDRLRKADAIARQIGRVVCTLLVADLTSQIGHDLADNPATGIAWTWIGWVFGLIVGWTAIGPLMARYAMYLLSPILEWMCQLLIAQGAIAESLRRRGPD